MPPRPDHAGELLGQESRKRRQHAVLALADRQDGVAGIQQLVALGFTYDQVRARIRSGQMTLLHRGVVIVGRRTVTARGHYRAALLTAGRSAFLTHRTGVSVYGLRVLNRFEIHISIPGGSRRNHANLVFHRTTKLHPSETRTYDGLRVASIPRLLVELAVREPASELRRIADEAARRSLLDMDHLHQTIARHAHRPGIARLARALGDYVHVPRGRSDLERTFHAWLAATLPDLPLPQCNIHLGPYEIDLYWPEHRLAVELDGRPYHVAVKHRERDNAKDIWLQQRGIRAMRIRDYRFMDDKAGIAADLLAFARPSARPARPSAPPTRPSAPPTRPSAPPTRPSKAA
jgi:hypothetical protein